jgi:DNA-binding FrmR family transcriptional regulator
MKNITDRIHRLQGQLSKIETQLEANTACDLVIPQLLATKGALDGIVREYLHYSLDSCVDAKDIESMKQVIKLLIKNS